MIGRERRMLLRHYLAQGASKAALARQFGIHRDTIHRWIRAGDLDRDLDAMPVCYGPRPAVPTKLAAYKGIIETRLTAYPELSAVRLLAEIRAAGYAGGYTQLKDFVRQVRPVPPPEARIRFETPAGRQAQVDFARFRFPWGVRYALLVVLGYSRLLWCRFYPRQDMRTLVSGLEDAFRYFDGVPRELLFDQMKAVITRDLRLEGGALLHNAEFLRFARHWGFTPRAWPPHLARAKVRELLLPEVEGRFAHAHLPAHVADGPTALDFAQGVSNLLLAELRRLHRSLPLPGGPPTPSFCSSFRCRRFRGRRQLLGLDSAPIARAPSECGAAGRQPVEHFRLCRKWLLGLDSNQQPSG